MANSAEEAAAAAVQGVEVTPSPPESKRQRRRVQSKLFWGSSPVGKVNGESTPETDAVVAFPSAVELEKNEEEEQKEEEDNGGGKRKRRRMNGSPKTRAAGKSPVTKVARKMGSGKKNSPAKNGSFQQTKNIRGERGRAKNDSTFNDVDTGTSHLRTNAKYNVVDDLDGQSLQINQPITNLRLEAKMAAEENMRLSKGKQMHPFFTCKKAAKKFPMTDDVIKMDSTHLSSFDQDIHVFFPPVHILDQQVDSIVLDWSKWNFVQKSIVNLNDHCDLDKTLAVFKDVAKPLRVDTASINLMHDDQSSVITNDTATTSVINCPALSDGHGQKEQPISDMKFHLDSNFCSLSEHDGCTNVKCEKQDTFGDERLLPYYRRCSYWPECTLWTEKYQPENAEEVCGNHDSVKELSEWLRLWHDKSSTNSRKCNYGDEHSIDETEDSPYEIESDMDEDACDLKNVLLVTGPVGSGKSAAIYACAKEHGFEVIEINTSDLRNGACLKQKFGDAMESHGLNRWSVAQSICPRTKHILGLQSVKSNFSEDKQFESSEAELTSQNCAQAKYSMESPNQIANKTLILFEDVDIVFDADHGFVSTILQLAEATRRPIILTSNCKNPILPLLLSRFALEFELPSTEELLRHCCMICASEKAQISSRLLENFIQSCHGDMRKTLLLLQFWCQGRNRHRVFSKQWSYSPLCFDIDAAHLVLPRVVPWGFHCELSEKIVEEISRTIFLMEENLLKLSSAEPASALKSRKLTDVKRKKKGKLKKNTSSIDCTDFPVNLNDLDDFHDTSKPAAEFSGRVRQRPRLVLSSQSDDSMCADEVPPTEITSVLSDNHPLAEAADMLNSKIVEMTSFLDVTCEQKCHIESRESDQHPLQFFGTISAANIYDTFRMQDVSFVPESSFVPGTEFNETDSFISLAVPSKNTVANLVDFEETNHVPTREEFNIFRGTTSEASLCFGNNSTAVQEVVVESMCESEGIGDSCNEVEEPQSSGYLFMDECSRADFNVQPVPWKCNLSSGVVSMQETWQGLRKRRDDLKSCLTNNQKSISMITKLTSGISDLMSETDIMLSCCNPLIADILEPLLTPSVEPDAPSWYDEQFEIGSTYAEHGLCFYAKKCIQIGANMGFRKTVDLAHDMLTSTNNIMAWGKLINQGAAIKEDIPNIARMKEARYDICSRRKLESGVLNTLLPAVPSRLSMALRGPGFSDYLSFISHISKLECSRLSGSMADNSRRRSRASRHYLTSGPLSLSCEDTKLLANFCSFKETVS